MTHDLKIGPKLQCCLGPALALVRLCVRRVFIRCVTFRDILGTYLILRADTGRLLMREEGLKSGTVPENAGRMVTLGKL